MTGLIKVGDTIEYTDDGGERTVAVVMCRVGGTHLHVVFLTDNEPSDWGMANSATYRVSGQPVTAAVKDAATVYFLTVTRETYDTQPFPVVAASFWTVSNNATAEIQAQVEPSPALIQWREQNDPTPTPRSTTRRPHGRPVHLVLLVVAVLVLAGCGAITTPDDTPATSKCPAGWVCTPGTSQCDPSYRCGICPDGSRWSYLDDGSELAREAQTDPQLNVVFDRRGGWNPCVTPTVTPTATREVRA